MSCQRRPLSISLDVPLSPGEDKTQALRGRTCLCPEMERECVTVAFVRIVSMASAWSSGEKVRWSMANEPRAGLVAAPSIPSAETKQMFCHNAAWAGTSTPARRGRRPGGPSGRNGVERRPPRRSR